jgi:hypothetical protein
MPETEKGGACPKKGPAHCLFAQSKEKCKNSTMSPSIELTTLITLLTFIRRRYEIYKNYS